LLLVGWGGGLIDFFLGKLAVFDGSFDEADALGLKGGRPMVIMCISFGRMPVVILGKLLFLFCAL
jgi:hypothetical protein